MASPAKTIAGAVVTAAGIFVATLPIPGAAQFAGKMIAVWGATMFLEGVFGTPQLNPNGSKFSVTSTQAPLPVIYGQRRVSHIVADIATHGTNNSWLDMIAGVCIAGESGKNIEGIQNIYLYTDTSITGSVVQNPYQVDNQTVAGRTDNVHSRYYKDPDWYYRYSIGLGKDTQLVDAHMEDIQGGRWGQFSGIANQQGKGIVTVQHSFFYDKDEEDNVWENGRPDDIQYDVRGALLFDPRYKTAGPDSDGWIWDRADNVSLSSPDNHPGQNPALQVLDYLTSKRYGLGIPYASRDGGTLDEIDEASFIAAANYCDTSVTTTGLNPNETVAMYTGNAIISTADPHKSNLEVLLAACNAMLAYEGGKYKIICRKPTTSVSYEITESEIIGEISMVRDGLTIPNIVTVRFPWEEARENIINWTWPYDAFDPAENGYLEADGDIPNERTIDLGGVTSKIHAQILAMHALREMREDVTISVKCRESALQLSVGDVVNVTYDSAGFSQKPFWVLGMELLNDGTVQLYLKEYSASVYSVDANADIPSVPGTNLDNPLTVTPPTNVVANCAAGYYLTEGAFIPRVEVTWTHTVDAFAHEEELVYRRDADAEWTFTGMKKKIADTAAVAWEGDLDIGETYWFGVVAWNKLGIRSTVAETASSCTITGPGETPSDVTILDSSFTCLEGINLTFDNPAVYTAANSVGVIEIGFYAIEIREQGAGATELDRWNNGTWLETVYGTEWNYPFDKLTKGTYDLSVRRIDKYGAYATTPTEINLTLTAWPCTGFGYYDPEQLGSVILNGDFEKSWSYWYSEAPTRTSLESVSPIGGALSLKLVADGAATTNVRQTNDPTDDETSGGSDLRYVPCQPGELWFLAGTAYTSSTNSVWLKVQFYDEDKVATSTKDVIAWYENTATTKKSQIVVPADSYYFNVVIQAAIGTGDCYVDHLTAVPRETTTPVAFYDIVHNGDSTATVTVRVFDLADTVTSFQMRIWDVATQAWGSWVPSTDPSVTVTNINSWTDDYEWDVNLHEKHDTYTEYDVTFVAYNDPTPTEWVNFAHLRQVITLDVDTVPEFVSFNVNVDEAGDVELHWGLDDDGNSIKYTKSTVDYATAGDPTGGTALNGTSGESTIHSGLTADQTLYVRAIPYTGASGTGDPGTREARDKVTFTAGIIYPTVREQLSYSGSSGVLDLDINDPDSRVTLVEFNTKSGTAAWSGWASDTAPYQATVTLAEKHDSHISWRVTYTNASATSDIIEGTVTYDLDSNPEFTTLTLDQDAGYVDISWSLDDDGLSIKYTTSTTSYAAAGDPTGGTPLDGRNSEANIYTTLAEEETLYVRAIPYTGANGTGTAGTQEGTVKVTRPPDTTTGYDTTPADVTGFTHNKYQKAGGGVVWFSWNKVETAGVTGYEIRKGGTGWADATYVVTTQSTFWRAWWTDVPPSATTYRIKALNDLEGLESANAATTTVSWATGRPTGSAASLISSYFRGTAGITRWNLATTNASIFRFHWGTSAAFTPSETNVVSVIYEDNPTADYAVGISLAETGWTDDSGRVLYLKVGVKDGLSDDIGESWSYSNGYSITLNPFETKHLLEDVTREFISGSYTDASRRPDTLRTAVGDLDADDAFDLTIDDTDDLTSGTTRKLVLGTYLDGSLRPDTLRTAVGDLDADDAFDLTIDDTDDLTSGTTRKLVLGTYLDGSLRPSILRTAVGDLDADDAFDLTIDDTDDLTQGATRQLVLGTYLDASYRPDTLRTAVGNLDADDAFDLTIDDTDDLTSGATRKLVLGTYLDASLRPTTLRRVVAASDLSGDDAFDTSADTTDDITIGATNAFINAGYIDGSARPVSIYRATTGSAISGQTINDRTQRLNDSDGDLISQFETNNNTIWVNTNDTRAIGYGTRAGGNTGYVAKRVTYDYASMSPISNFASLVVVGSSGYIYPYTSGSTVHNWSQSLFIPAGCKVTTIYCRHYHRTVTTVASTCQTSYYRMNGTTETLIVTEDNPGNSTGTWQVEDHVWSTTVADGDTFKVVWAAQHNTQNTYVRWQYTSWYYQMPEYQAGY